MLYKNSYLRITEDSIFRCRNNFPFEEIEKKTLREVFIFKGSYAKNPLLTIILGCLLIGGLIYIFYPTPNEYDIFVLLQKRSFNSFKAVVFIMMGIVLVGAMGIMSFVYVFKRGYYLAVKKNSGEKYKFPIKKNEINKILSCFDSKLLRDYKAV